MKGWLTAEWGKTAENRRARYYRPTKASKKQLSEQLKRYERTSQAIAQIVRVLILERPSTRRRGWSGANCCSRSGLEQKWGWMSLERVLQDLRFAVRMLRKYATMFSMVGIARFALGAGANALMFKAIITSLGRMRSTYCLKTCVMSCA